MATEAQRAYQRKWHANNRERRMAEKRERSARFKAKLNNLKSEAGCSNCGEKDFRCLDFHHNDATTKAFGIAAAVRFASWEAIQTEVAKCQILCANCHRKFHYIG